MVSDSEYTSDARACNDCERCGQPLRAEYLAKSDSTIVSMVTQGLGAAILPHMAAEPIPVVVLYIAAKSGF